MSQVALRACCAVAKVFERQPTVASAVLVAAVHGIYYQCLYQGRTFSIFELEVPDSDSKRGGRCQRVLAKAGPMEAALLGATIAKRSYTSQATCTSCSRKQPSSVQAMGASGSTRIASAPANRLAALLPSWPVPAASAATSSSYDHSEPGSLNLGALKTKLELDATKG